MGVVLEQSLTKNKVMPHFTRKISAVLTTFMVRVSKMHRHVYNNPGSIEVYAEFQRYICGVLPVLPQELTVNAENFNCKGTGFSLNMHRVFTVLSQGSPIIRIFFTFFRL